MAHDEAAAAENQPGLAHQPAVMSGPAAVEEAGPAAQAAATSPSMAHPWTTVTKTWWSCPFPPYVVSTAELASSVPSTVVTLTSRVAAFTATRPSVLASDTARLLRIAPAKGVVYPPTHKLPTLEPGCAAADASELDSPARVSAGSIVNFEAMTLSLALAPDLHTLQPASIQVPGERKQLRLREDRFDSRSELRGNQFGL